MISSGNKRRGARFEHAKRKFARLESRGARPRTLRRLAVRVAKLGNDLQRRLLEAASEAS